MILKQNEIIDATGAIVESTDWTNQKIGVIVLAALVGITQFVSIVLNNKRQQKTQENQVSDIPEYRRPKQTEQQQMTAKTMKFMLYFMAFMMVLFVWQSAAGLGVYWVVGNIYSTLQTWLGQKGTEKRLAKLKEKHRGRI